MSSNPDLPIDLCTAGVVEELLSVGTDCSAAITITESDGSCSHAELSLLLSANKSELSVVKVPADSATLATTSPAKSVECTSAPITRAEL